MSCSRCGYSACYSVHSCPRCNPKKPDYAQNLQNAKAMQASIDSAFLTITKLFLSLFLHPYFCFVGFWIIGVVSLFALAPLFGLVESWEVSPWESAPDWYRYTALALPIALAVALRKVVPTIMKWILISAVSLLALWGAIELVLYLRSR